MNNNDFSNDIKEFLELIHNQDDKNQIKKTYLQLVKKYHPDSVGDELKSTYNEYMLLINKVYSQGKSGEKTENPYDSNSAENKIKANQQEKKIYSFTSYYNTEYTFTDYYKYLYEKGKNEWDWATCMLGSGGQNHANDPKGLSDHTCEIMGHLYNSTVCLKEVITHAKKQNDLITVSSCQDFLQRIYKTNNRISQSIIQSESKSLLG